MIRLSDISKAYGRQRVFENFSLEIENGKILCVLGESGGGKTTLLNILAGLVPFSGNLWESRNGFLISFRSRACCPI